MLILHPIIKHMIEYELLSANKPIWAPAILIKRKPRFPRLLIKPSPKSYKRMCIHTIQYENLLVIFLKNTLFTQPDYMLMAKKTGSVQMHCDPVEPCFSNQIVCHTPGDVWWYDGVREYPV